MKKWVMLTVFLIATSLVSIYVNVSGDTLKTRIDSALESRQYDQAIPLLREWADQNKANPQIYTAAQQQIAFCQAKLGSPANTDCPATAPAVADGPILIDPNTGNPRVPHPRPAAGEALSMTITELGNFPFEPETDKTVPADVMALSGHTITLPGFITPFDESATLTYFAVMPALNGCCFGKPAGVQHTIICRAAPDTRLEYTPEHIAITGRLLVKPIRENDFTHTVFTVEVLSIKPM